MMVCKMLLGWSFIPAGTRTNDQKNDAPKEEDFFIDGQNIRWKVMRNQVLQPIRKMIVANHVNVMSQQDGAKF